MKYDSPRNVFQAKVNSILTNDSKHSDLFETIFKLQQVISFEKISRTDDPKDSWGILLELYLMLGPSLFAKTVTIMKGKTVTFPTEEEYQDSIITTLCYYYKEMEGLSWDEIKEKLNEPKLNAIKYGIRVRQLKSFIDEKLFKRLKREEKK
jgi:hypothetical protein